MADEWTRNSSKRQRFYAIILAPDEQGNPPACWLCRQPGADSIDHVLPKSKYPDLIWEPGNMRPAHGDCNSSKGDGVAARDMGSQSRRF